MAIMAFFFFCFMGLFSSCSFSVTAFPIIRPRLVICRSPNYRFCFNIQLYCPSFCPTSCFIDCATCRPICSCNYPGAVCQDPRFVGGDGVTFYFHGLRDRDFCLVSDADLHINAHFIGKRNPKLSRDFTWVQSIGVMFDNHNLLVATKQTQTWDDNFDRLEISLDDAPILLPAIRNVQYRSPFITIKRTSDTNHLIIEATNKFTINAAVVPITEEESRVHGYNITSEDCFAHLELGFKFYNLTNNVNGVLGQTYRSDYVSKIKPSSPMPVMGGLNKYLVSGIFAADCAVTQFGQRWNPVNNV